MSSKKGWIKLYRDITEHWVFRDPLLLKIWIDILFMANHESKKIPLNNQLIEIHRGQFWTSVRKLSARWNIDTKTTAKKLKLLQSDGMIYVDSRKGYGTLVTVQNYGVYQDFSEGDSHTYSHTNSHKVSHKDSHKVGFESPSEIPYKQEYKNDKALIKNGKKNNGLPPDDPDYFEEV